MGATKLTEWRQSRPEREKAERQAQRIGIQRDKRVLCAELLTEGKSSYACQLACRERFGSGVGYELIQAIQAELALDNPEGAIVPVELPPEMLEDPEVAHKVAHEVATEMVVAEAACETDIVVAVPPGLNGTLKNIQAIQRWMATVNAESLRLTRGGKLSVLARHEFDIGEIE